MGKYNLRKIGTRLEQLNKRKGRNFFSLKVGEEAMIRFNPGKDEPYESYVHWIEQGTSLFSIPCVGSDNRFVNGCPGCLMGVRPSTRFFWNIVDTRLVHWIREAQKTRVEACLADQGICPHCKSSQPELIGQVYWETSIELTGLILEQAQNIGQFCKCGGKLAPHGWNCPECGTSHEGVLPPTAVKHKCSSCENIVEPETTFICNSCDDPRQAELSDGYWKVKRTGRTSYSFWLDGVEPPHKAHQFDPLNIPEAIKKSPEEVLSRLGITKEQYEQAILPGASEAKQLPAGQEASRTQNQNEPVW